MSRRIVIERWRKGQVSRSKVEAFRNLRLEEGALSSEVSEEEREWILTTVFGDTDEEAGEFEEEEDALDEGDEGYGESSSGDDEPY